MATFTQEMARRIKSQGWVFFRFTKQKQKKQWEKSYLNPNFPGLEFFVNYRYKISVKTTPGTYVWCHACKEYHKLTYKENIVYWKSIGHSLDFSKII